MRSSRTGRPGGSLFFFASITGLLSRLAMARSVAIRRVKLSCDGVAELLASWDVVVASTRRRPVRRRPGGCRRQRPAASNANTSGRTWSSRSTRQVCGADRLSSPRSRVRGTVTSAPLIAALDPKSLTGKRGPRNRVCFLSTRPDFSASFKLAEPASFVRGEGSVSRLPPPVLDGGPSGQKESQL